MRLRSHLAALVVAVLVPMVVFAAIVMVVLGRQQRAAAERGAVETARAVMNAVDENLKSTITTLEALSVSQALVRDDLRELHAEMRRVLTTQADWYDVILLTPDARTLVDTQFAFGTPSRLASEPASVYAAVATRRPVVGYVARGPAGQYALPIRVPVVRGERVVYVLTAVVKPESLLAVLRHVRTDPEWVITAFDGRKTIVARTKSFADFLGQSVSAEFAALLDRGRTDGWALTRTLEGRRVYTAYARSAVTGWGIGIGVPVESVDGPLRGSILAIAAGAVGFTILALFLALVVGRRITAPMAALADAARRFGESGALGADDPAPVGEVEDVRRAFVGAAELVRRRAEDAEAAARAKDEFLAVLSHELRTPLNAVYGWARILQNDKVSDAQLARALDVIVRQSNAQVQLIDDLLDVSRMVTGKMRLDVRPVDLARVITQALDAVRPAADAKRIGIERALGDALGPLVGDPDRLQQVVWNLVMNAVKFTPPGGRVDVRAARAGGQVEIVVEDTGLGIAPEVLPYVFDRFRQADSSSTREHGGLGLGLALVKHLVELHGGSVAAHSAGVGQGATFVVMLPLAASDAAGVAAVTAGRPARAVSTARSRLDGVGVLVVDDDPQALDVAVALLTTAGAVVRAATSAAEGYAVLRTWRPDVLVSDIGMPDEDGYALIRRVRALHAAEGGRTPAVALTAYGRAQDRELALSAGYTMHVPKPVDPDELTAIVASLAAGPAPTTR